MKKSKLSLKFATALMIGALGFSVIGTPVVLAATTKPAKGGGQALEIAPPIMSLKANPGQTIKTQIKIRDISATDLVVTNEINDFIAAGEGGTPKILLNSDTNDPFSMKNWVQPLPQLTLKPKQIKTLNVTIDVPKNASPGGHYSVIRFTGRPPELKGQGVSLSASLGSLVLLTVSGNIKENLSISQFAVGKPSGKDKTGVNTGWFFRNTPLTFVEKIKNTGNLQEQPSGIITVTNMFGHKVAAMEVNQPPHQILPSSTRKFTEVMDKSVIGKQHFFGHYTAHIQISYGKDKVVSSELTFWVIPWVTILALIAALIVAFFVFRFFLRRYKRRILSQVQGQSAAKKPTRRPAKQKNKSRK